MAPINRKSALPESGEITASAVSKVPDSRVPKGCKRAASPLERADDEVEAFFTTSRPAAGGKKWKLAQPQKAKVSASKVNSGADARILIADAPTNKVEKGKGKRARSPSPASQEGGGAASVTAGRPVAPMKKSSKFMHMRIPSEAPKAKNGSVRASLALESPTPLGSKEKQDKAMLQAKAASTIAYQDDETETAEISEDGNEDGVPAKVTQSDEHARLAALEAKREAERKANRGKDSVMGGDVETLNAYQLRELVEHLRKRNEVQRETIDEDTCKLRNAGKQIKEAQEDVRAKVKAVEDEWTADIKSLEKIAEKEKAEIEAEVEKLKAEGKDMKVEIKKMMTGIVEKGKSSKPVPLKPRLGGELFPHGERELGKENEALKAELKKEREERGRLEAQLADLKQQIRNTELTVEDLEG